MPERIDAMKSAVRLNGTRAHQLVAIASRFNASSFEGSLTAKSHEHHAANNLWIGGIVFPLIAVAGPFYVKWFPYHNRAFVAAVNNSIGSSMLMRTAACPPTPYWDTAFNYALGS